MDTKDTLKVVVLTAIDSASNASAIAALVALEKIKIAGIVFDTAQPSFLRRLRNLKRNVQREGSPYILFRVRQLFLTLFESLAARVVPESQTLALLARAFPERPLALEHLSAMFPIPIHYVDNLNSPAGVDLLQGLAPDLGIVIGTRVLKRSTFSVPRLGCINVHKGKVPEYRGLPPGFWEIYEDQSQAGVTIHCVDDGLDTGEILAQECISIHEKDSVETLQRKLDGLAETLLVRSVAELARGDVSRTPQPASNHRPKTSPTRAQRLELEQRRRLNEMSRQSLSHLLKTVFAVMVYYSGLFHLVQALKRALGANRVCVVLYHRVNDLCEDVLTTSVKRFAEHLIAIQRHYSVITSTELLERLNKGARFDEPTVIIHFDDCYRDVYTNASCILAAANLPGCAFISSGFVGTTRRFPHDLAICPFTLENLNEDELTGLLKRNFEIGSHSVSHADLAQCDDSAVTEELTQSKKDLEAMLHKPVSMFSYPFGGKHNVRRGIADLVRQSGYHAMFSAYGGYVSHRTDPFNIPRIGASGRFRPLDLILEIEGLSLGAIWRALKTKFLGPEPAPNLPRLNA